MTERDSEYWSKIVARIFNRTALGAWTLLALYLGYSGEYAISAAMLLIGIPVYFKLEDRFYAD
jgi:hypothetical protein